MMLLKHLPDMFWHVVIFFQSFLFMHVKTFTMIDLIDHNFSILRSMDQSIYPPLSQDRHVVHLYCMGN